MFVYSNFVKRAIVLFSALALFVAATPGPYEKYIEKYSSVAVSEMHRSGVPASITLAQGLVESAAGQSTLATKANNHFGIKCHSDWKGKKTYRDDDKANECFRVYSNAAASFKDHSDFLRYQDRYKFLFDLDPTDYKGWAKGTYEVTVQDGKSILHQVLTHESADNVTFTESTSPSEYWYEFKTYGENLLYLNCTKTKMNGEVHEHNPAIENYYYRVK